jgi:nucleotide-binding universal stress UspA family protein
VANEQDPLVVIAYDGSEGARDAVRRAAETVSQRTALVVYAYPRAEEMSAGLGVPVTMPTSAVETVRRRAAEIADKGAELARTSGFSAEAVTVEAKGGVADALLALARERDAAAIVVGSRGLGGATSALLGSVSSKLIHDGDRPIVVVPHSRPT